MRRLPRAAVGRRSRPQAYAERDFIRALIAQGLTKPQIERQLVAQYGPAVLGKPPADGFNLTVYVLPPAIVLIGLGILAYALPRWRRRSKSRTGGRRGQRPAAPRRGGRQAARRGPRRVSRLRPPEPAPYIESGALTPSRPSDSAIVRCAATDSAIRNDSSSSGSTPTTRQCS